ncbi:pyruvate kinase [Nocardia seriolae]|uniref:pyruvate kinase n=1 Tax=Nocardia seriolae TaxID=37332 RepID=A0ABC9YMF2_9NOCA|nr:pyruvate kinase [Nocardia seriolae]BAW06869.1 pyruvate kinase [Nocardia seriolae]BEK88546.1 pyruvate kinase [Nocardia seriolae]BEK96299.1 pyruvate kinase [Nocardia seriolae]GAM44668.1 pyruvate kinase [Nocardia seriolae]GAP26676.1 pyruvate kinase [Nocardia seriolae]
MRIGDLDRIITEIDTLRDALADAERQWAVRIAGVDPRHRAGALNLVHYWAIRQFDLRGLQRRLAAFGLSSLGRSQGHVASTLNAIGTAARALAHSDDPDRLPPNGYTAGANVLRRRTFELLGPAPARRSTRIMVTLPGTAAADPQLIADLVDRGMDVARINCAHDDPAAWAAMITELRREGPRSCRVAMDLAGPKLRTGPIAQGPPVVKLRPVRDVLGRVTETAWCWLTPIDRPGPPPRADVPVLPVDAAWLSKLAPTSTFRLQDARDAKRLFTVVHADAGGALACTGRTAYILAGTKLVADTGVITEVGPLPPVEQHLVLSPGDTLLLTRDCVPAEVPPRGLPRIGCTLPEVFGNVRRRQPILFDDGRITGRILDCDADTITVTITEATAPGSKLRAGKGINLPETTLPVPALTETDRANLPFVIEHADLVEMSFVRTRQDVSDLLAALDELGGDGLGVIVKIETAQGFRNLPAILLEVMRRPRAGVMIARGDLAVECGYERLAELQEEILWLCEAAHLPVIWATQVLDQLARSGRPSRAEITDAAMGVRAECVMLNKGAVHRRRGRHPRRHPAAHERPRRQADHLHALSAVLVSRRNAAGDRC